MLIFYLEDLILVKMFLIILFMVLKNIIEILMKKFIEKKSEILTIFLDSIRFLNTCFPSKFLYN